MMASEYSANHSDATWHEVYGPSLSACTPPRHFGSLDVELGSQLDIEVAALGVVEVSGATVYGNAGWVFAADGCFLADLSWFGRHADSMLRIPRRLPKTETLPGVTLSLASDFAKGSYGHVLMDSLSRLHLFWQAGFCFDDVDHIICSRPPSKTARQFYEKLAIPLDKCIWIDEYKRRAIRVEKLLAPTFPGARMNYPQWLPPFLQRSLLSPQAKADPARRLYISRSGGRRNIANEQAIEAILKKYGFEIYNPASGESQPEDFVAAEIVVGPHGSGLTDLAFCRPGTRVLELMPTDHVAPYYYSLSCAAGLQYSYMVGLSIEHREQKVVTASAHDFHVDEFEFEQALSQLCDEHEY